jgi:hypothetical protein
MNEIKVSFLKCKFTSKPIKPEAAEISSKIANKIETINGDNIKRFVKLVGEDGCTFCPATFKNGKRNKENFEQQQLFALDFDDGISFDEFKNRTEEFDLPFLFAYETFSSIDQNKFRAVFMNDLSISNRIVAEAILLALGTIFPEADRSCYKDVSKLYFGGKKLIYYDDTLPEIDIELLFRRLTYYLKERYKLNHYKKKIEEFSQETGIGLNQDGFLDVRVSDEPTEDAGATISVQKGSDLDRSLQDVSISPNAIIYNLYNIIANGEIDTIRQYKISLDLGGSTSGSSVGKRSLRNHKSYRLSDLRGIDDRCRLFREFTSGQIKIEHDQLFGIATNLINVDSGPSRFMAILSAKDHLYKATYHKWRHDLSYMTQNNYQPQSCNSFCPYKNECDHGTNLLSSVKLKRGMIERTPDYKEELSSVEEAEVDVDQAIREACVVPTLNLPV